MAPADEQITGATDVPPGYEEFLSWVRATKTHCVANHPLNTDLAPAIRIWGSTPFQFEVTALLNEMDRDKALWVASLLCGMIGADGVTMVSDAYVAAEGSPNDPRSGKPWGGGALNTRWEEGDHTSVTECMMFHTVFTNGRQRAEISRYRITDTGTLAWDRTTYDVLDTANAGHSTSGLVPESLADALSRPELIVTLDNLFVDMGMPLEVAFVHRVAVAVEQLLESGVICMVGGAHPLLEERLTRITGAQAIRQTRDPLDDLLRD